MAVLLPHLLAALDARHPGVRAIVSEGSTSALLPGLLTGRFNGAIIHLPVDDPELTIEPLFAEDLLLVAHGDHPLADRGELPLAELSRHRLLLPPAGSALRRVLDRAAAKRRAAPCPGRDRRRAAPRHPGDRRPRRRDRAGDGDLPACHRPLRRDPRPRAAASRRGPRLPATSSAGRPHARCCSGCSVRCWRRRRAASRASDAAPSALPARRRPDLNRADRSPPPCG